MKKMNKQEFIARIAREQDISLKQARYAYDIVVRGIEDVVRDGYRLSLMGFGSFFMQTHKGHPVHVEETTKEVADYKLFRFKASHALSQRIRE